MKEKIESLLAQMTLEEKVSLLAGADHWHTMPLQRLGIPAIRVTDGPNGARGSRGNQGPTSACFPVGVALGATWNPELIRRVGAALGEEVQAKSAHILLAPTVNIHRSPLAGRHFECYSEDPYLTSRIAIAYIQGVQSRGVGACIKHFVCNDSEFERRTISSEVPERALREIYLFPFQAAIKEAKPWAVMSAYNKVNGTSCSENSDLLKDILKGEWGFEGLVMSDWWGTYSDQVARGGLDLEMPGPARWMGQHVLHQLETGEIRAAEIDDKVRRILRTIALAGAFEQPDLRPERAEDKPEHRRLIREAAGEAIVLLKNEGAMLPLDREKIGSIAVIGANARWAQIQGGGSAHVTPHYVVSPLEGIRARAGGTLQVDYEIGCPIHRMVPLPETRWMTGADGMPNGLTIAYFDNPSLAGEPAHTEHCDRFEITWHANVVPYVNLEAFSICLSGTFIPPETGIYTFGLMSVGRSRLWIDDDILIDQWTEIGKGLEKTAPMELHAGRPHGIRVEYAFQGQSRWLPLRLGCLPPLPGEPIEAAVALAARSDVAIVFAGLTDEWESEGADRIDMDLRGEQVELIDRVAAANPNTIVVLNTGSPVTMPWLERVPAVLQAWFTGQEAGNAIADVLFGQVNPSGKLPTTFPKRLQDNPAYINYPGENDRVHYGEGLFVGYRYYDKKDLEPLFPFGHGLSYSHFAYRDLALEPTCDLGQEIRVSLEVENTGSRAGQEVVQLYVRDLESSLIRPEKELKAFAKVALEAGQKKRITLVLEGDALAFYDDRAGRWVSEPGEFELLVGSSSRDIRLRGRLALRDPRLDSVGRLHIGMPLQAILDDERGRQVLERHVGAHLKEPELQLVLDLPFKELAAFVPQVLTPEKLAQINEELGQL